MKLNFAIDYRTTWGESLYIVGFDTHGNDYCVAMNLSASHRWKATLTLRAASTVLTYTYEVRRNGETSQREWGQPHRLVLASSLKELNVIDCWQDIPTDKSYYSALFTDVINRRDNRDRRASIHAGTLVLSVKAPMVGRDEVLAIVGDTPPLGNWNPTNAVVMNDSDFPTWTVSIDRNRLPEKFQYKFVILSRTGGELLAWEGGENRCLSLPNSDDRTSTTLGGLRFYDSRSLWRGAGVAIPLFSIRSNDDFGVGDFYDLIKMVDWAVATGQTVIQILPINDTTMTGSWVDSYPYNACSTFALHPMYMRLSELGELKSESRRDYYSHLAAELNDLTTVDYERVNNAKRQYIAEAFALYGSSTLCSEEFTEFMLANGHWLRPYAAYCVLRDINATPDFSRWGKYATYTADIPERLYAEHNTEMNIVYYTQFHLDRQMRHVHDYASRAGVAIKGDIPIGISRFSVDAWTNPRLFNMDSQAGAPPDDFSVMGQNWGFPTYNWDEMATDNYSWWKSRLTKMADYFDAYRIDHILGFFRIWEIPLDAIHGLLGTFNPALPFTADELRENYSFFIEPTLHCCPSIAEPLLREIFGDNTDEVTANYLVDTGDGNFQLVDEVSTQRKIVHRFATLEKTDSNAAIAEGLMTLLDQVLFIEDRHHPGHYHPRIAAQQTSAYNRLDDGQKYNFNRLYNDFFYRRHNRFWEEKAMGKLPALLEATEMLACGEDLGMIPACVPNVMNRLQILSLELQRMPKDSHTTFGNTWAYPYLSVCTTSTHDMGGVRQWWEESREASQAFYHQVLGCNDPVPYFAEPWICDRIANLQLQSPSMLAIMPLQDWLSVSPDLRRPDPRQEQINVPANPRHYWRYRMHLKIETLLAADKFNQSLRDRIHNAARQ